MRIKTAFIFVLLANMVLLAHAVIPHHHHTEDPVEIVVECTNTNHEDHTDHKRIPVCDDDHKEGEIAPCITTTMLVPNNQFRAITSLEQITTSNVLPFTLLVFNYNTIPDGTINSVEVIENVPLYSRLLTSSQGLRAPPVC
jgi:Family of unknown function (DUF6769)